MSTKLTIKYFLLNFRLSYLIILAQIFQSIIPTVSSLPCNYNNIGKYYGSCQYNKRNVYFYWINECDESDLNSINLPEALINTDCFYCSKGSILDYDVENNKFACNSCPANTYSSGGALRVDGALKEWNNDTQLIKGFNFYCDIEDFKNNRLDTKCDGWNFSGENSYITAGATNITSGHYYAGFWANIQLVRSGKISFRYRKVNSSLNKIFNGVFMFILNFVVHMEDYSSSNEWIEKSFNLEAGSYTILWEYDNNFYSNIDNQNKATVQVEFIEIDGLETADFTCKKCIQGTSEPSSSSCEFCKENFYYDQTTESCVKCPEDTYSDPNSLGPGSCKIKPPCTENDYYSYIDEVCNLDKSTQGKKFEWTPPLKCNDKTGVSLPPTIYIKCLPCQKGTFMNKLNPSEGKCEKCPKGFYSEKENFNDKCELCENGNTKNILRLSDIGEQNINSYNFELNGWTILNNKLVVKENEYSTSILSKEINIVETVGYFSLNFTLTHNLEEGESLEFSLNGGKIENQEYKSKGSYKLTIVLEKGKNSVVVQVNQNKHCMFNVQSDTIVEINWIEVSNSNEGSGYDCVECLTNEIVDNFNNVCKECPEGTEKENNTCIPCKEGYVKTQNEKKCRICPPFTSPNNNKTGCELLDVIHYKPEHKRFIIKGLFDHQQKVLCNSNEDFCYGNFLGPILGDDIFFASLNSKLQISLNDFSYSTKFNKVQNGYIYSLSNFPLDNNERNGKVLLNKGSEIEYVKIFSINGKEGLIFSYIDGDTCLSEPSLKYSSIFIILCDKEVTEGSPTYFNEEYITNNNKSPVYIKSIHSNCTHVFEWRTRYGCPSCLKSELTSIPMPCRFNERVSYFYENSKCIIESPSNKTGENYFVDNSSALLTYDILDDELKSYFKPNFKNTNSTNIDKKIIYDLEYPYVDSKKETEYCQMYKDYDIYVLVIGIIVPTLYIFVVVALICYCVKLRSIRNRYQQLVEDRDGEESSSKSRSNTKDQQLELGTEVSERKVKNI